MGHSTVVLIGALCQNWGPPQVLVVTQTIFVRNRAQLKIVVGVRGNTINLMTAGAEAALGMALDRKIHLKVRVKVASKKE